MNNEEAEVVARDNTKAQANINEPAKKIRLSKLKNLVNKYYQLKGKIEHIEKIENKIEAKKEKLEKESKERSESLSDAEFDYITNKINKLNIKIKYLEIRKSVLQTKQAKRIKVKNRVLGPIKRIFSLFGRKNVIEEENNTNQFQVARDLVEKNKIDLSNDIDKENVSNMINAGFDQVSNTDKPVEDENNTVTSEMVQNEDTNIVNQEENDMNSESMEKEVEEKVFDQNETEEKDLDVPDFASDEVTSEEAPNIDSYFDNITNKEPDNIEIPEQETNKEQSNFVRENVIVTPTKREVPFNVMTAETLKNDIGNIEKDLYNNDRKYESVDFVPESISEEEWKESTKNAMDKYNDRNEKLIQEANELMGKLGIDLSLLTEEEKSKTFEACKERIIAKREKNEKIAEEAKAAERLKVAKEHVLNQFFDKINSVIDQDKSEAELAQQRANDAKEQAEKISSVNAQDLEMMLEENQNNNENEFVSQSSK